MSGAIFGSGAKFYSEKNSSLKLGHTDTINLKKGREQYGKANFFKWKHYQPDIILLTVRWYLRYNCSLGTNFD